MHFYLTETPFSRISSPALRKSFSLLGVTLPSATTLRTTMLDKCHGEVQLLVQDKLQDIQVRPQGGVQQQQTGHAGLACIT